MRKSQRQRGVALVEFTIAGIPSMILLISTFSLAMGMWNYHTLAYAVHEGTRYVSVKGKNCTLPGNTCAVSVGTIAQKIGALGIGLVVTLAALGPTRGAIAFGLAGASMSILGMLAHRRIGGFTGDVLGAFQQIGEIVMLLTAAAK